MSGPGVKIAIALAAIALGVGALLLGGDESPSAVAGSPAGAPGGTASGGAASGEEESGPRGNPVVVVGPGEDASGAEEELAPGGSDVPEDPDARDDAPSPSAPSDDEVTAEFRALKKHAGKSARLTGDGDAIAPFDAPPAVQRIIAAGNIISRSPYKWGGGHGRWLDDGYDCSGSVSFALAAAGLLDAPLVSGDLARWGSKGKGRWVTVYANDGHVFMVVAGLRFDTSGRDSRSGGSRWQPEMRSASGYSVRHPRGL